MTLGTSRISKADAPCAVACASALLLASCVPFLTQEEFAAVESAYMREQVAVEDLPARLQKGDEVQVVTRQGKEKLLSVYAVRETAFFGVAAGGKKYEVPYGAIRTIAIRRPKTGAEVAGSWLLLILTQTPAHPTVISP